MLLCFFLYRVFAPPNSFLLLLYSPVKPTPEFWECCVDLVTIIRDIPFTSQNRHLSFHRHQTIIVFVNKNMLQKASLPRSVTFKTLRVTNKLHNYSMSLRAGLVKNLNSSLSFGQANLTFHLPRATSCLTC